MIAFWFGIPGVQSIEKMVTWGIPGLQPTGLEPPVENCTFVRHPASSKFVANRALLAVLQLPPISSVGWQWQRPLFRLPWVQHFLNTSDYPVHLAILTINGKRKGRGNGRGKEEEMEEERKRKRRREGRARGKEKERKDSTIWGPTSWKRQYSKKPPKLEVPALDRCCNVLVVSQI